MFKICQCPVRHARSTRGDNFIYFRNICNDIAFNRAILIKRLFCLKALKKSIAYHATWKFPTASKNRFNHSYNHIITFNHLINTQGWNLIQLLELSFMPFCKCLPFCRKLCPRATFSNVFWHCTLVHKLAVLIIDRFCISPCFWYFNEVPPSFQ